MDNYHPKVSKSRPEAFGMLLGVHVEDNPVYLPIEFHNTWRKNNEVLDSLCRKALLKYNILR